MVITANTKIAGILKQNSAALEAIVSLSPRFEKLRNPFLRKLMAGRASVAMASRIGGCSINEFFQKLQPLGFEADETAPVIVEKKEQLPEFIKLLKPEDVIVLDMRPVIAAGNDPLSVILKNSKHCSPDRY